MRLKFRLLLMALCSSALLLACTKKPNPLERYRPTLNVNVPGGVKNSEPDPNIARAEDHTVSLDGKTRYVGIYQVSDTSDVLSRLKTLRDQDAGKPIYFQGSFASEFRDALSLFDSIRVAGWQTVALIVQPAGQSAYQRLTVRLPEQANPDAEIPKPSPMALDIEVKGDGILLNKKQITTVKEIEKLQTALAEPLKNRTADADKVVTVKGMRVLRYQDIVEMIDAAKGAGASSVVLIIDDVP